MKPIRVSKRKPCQLCGSPDWCGISDDGEVAFCMRVASPKQAKNGAYIHVLDDSFKSNPRPKLINKPKKEVPVKRNANDINDVFTAFLAQCVLANNHNSELRRRGLSAYDIIAHGYKSNPTQMFATRICSNLIRDGFDLRGVPGFYRFTDWHFRTYNAHGFLIPIRNSELEIVGLQLRSDNGQKWESDNIPKYLMISSDGKPLGTSSGTPPHFAAAGLLKRPSEVEKIIITEGALKANIIQKFTGEPTIGIVGVGCFDDTFPEMLRRSFSNLKTCEIAFDMDYQFNPAVRSQLNRLILTLENSGLKTSVLSWNRQFKGFDDFLAAKGNHIKLAA